MNLTSIQKTMHKVNKPLLRALLVPSVRFEYGLSTREWSAWWSDFLGLMLASELCREHPCTWEVHDKVYLERKATEYNWTF